MKKLITTALVAGLFLGCATTNNQTKITPLNLKVLKEYQVSQTSLRPLNNGYVFFKTGIRGVDIYYLDKNYNLLKKVTTKSIEPFKLKIENNKIYILGEKNNKPIILMYDDKGKLIKSYSVGNKFDIPADIIDNKVLLTKYNNGSYISFGKIDLKSTKNLTATSVIKVDGGYMIFGTILEKSEDLFIAFIKNNKLKWSKVYDFGMDNGIESVKVENNEIYLNVFSTDYMGAKTEYKIVLDKNGNIIKKSKTLEIKELPPRFRT